MIEPPNYCTLLGYRSGTADGRTNCRLLAAHPGDCTVNRFAWAQGSDIREDALIAAEEAEGDWYNHQRWLKIAPPRYRDVDFDQLDQAANIKQALEEWVDREWEASPDGDELGNIILMGGVGSGKTHTACAVTRRVMAGHNKISAVITTTSTMFRKLRPEGGATPDDYIQPRILLLDDVGIEKSSEWTEERLFEIVDSRWMNNSPIIATTNLTPAELKDSVGIRVFDRLRDGALALALPGPSRRKASVAA